MRRLQLPASASTDTPRSVSPGPRLAVVRADAGGHVARHAEAQAFAERPGIVAPRYERDLGVIVRIAAIDRRLIRAKLRFLVDEGRLQGQLGFVEPPLAAGEKNTDVASPPPADKPVSAGSTSARPSADATRTTTASKWPERVGISDSPSQPGGRRQAPEYSTHPVNSTDAIRSGRGAGRRRPCVRDDSSNRRARRRRRVVGWRDGLAARRTVCPARGCGAVRG